MAEYDVDVVVLGGGSGGMPLLCVPQSSDGQWS